MISNTTPRNAVILGIAATLAGAAALIVRKVNHARKVRILGSRRVVPHRDVPIWAQAAAIVASSASALLLLVRQRV